MLHRGVAFCAIQSADYHRLKKNAVFASYKGGVIMTLGKEAKGLIAL